MKDEKFVKLSAIEEMAQPMKKIHEDMGDGSEEYTCPKCGHEWSDDEDDGEEDEDY